MTTPVPTRMVAALYVATDGAYFGLPDVDPWDEPRDARRYAGPCPVVAHPPCQLWVNFAAVNWRRYGRVRPAWYPGGTDNGCFAHALSCVRRFGGVLEHPAFSKAWRGYGLNLPSKEGGWIRGGHPFVTPSRVSWSYTCEVWQSAYGHRARKRTWLYYVGPEPPELDWSRNPGTHQIGWFDRNKPTLGKRAANATPPAFRDVLLSLARGCHK